jgi:small ligand-binding sensory domain FIST
MALFPFGHATHPQWQMAAGLVLAQVRAQMALHGYASAPTLGLLYITDHYAAHAQDILDHLGAELPEVTDWSGTVGVGIASSNVEYFDEPGLAVMLCALPPHQYRVFSGVAPLSPGFTPHTALVHADAGTPDVADLIAEMADRTTTGYLFGGLASSRSDVVQFAIGGNGNLQGHGKAGGVFRGGLSGVAFAEGVQIVSRVTQGCQPVSGERRITGADGNLVTELDGEPALDVLLQDLNITLDEPQAALAALRTTLVGLTQATEDVVSRTGRFGTDVLVRHIIGVDPRRRGVAIANRVDEGMKLAFCRRDVEAARSDLVRICSEIREELEPEEISAAAAHALATADVATGAPATAQVAGAVYVSCAGRGGPHFGGPSAEMQIVRRALGDVPLVGFFAGGEIARSHLYGYTGVLTVFR